MTESSEVLDFWFQELTPKDHFSKNLELDETIRKRFAKVYQQALEGKTSVWRQTARGRLAEIIVLDQFPRNMFRDTAQAFQSDAQALELAMDAVRVDADQDLAINERAFLYMPYMHSEDKNVHSKAVALFSQPGLEFNLKFEMAHKAIIDRFGRYPHRNQVLNRKSTADEVEFLNQPGSSF